MGFLTLLKAASMPIVQVLIISVLGAFMSTTYCNLLHADARKSLNKIVFMVFTPSLILSNLSKSVTIEDIISWWFMPFNVGLTFLFGGLLGWMMVKLIKPDKHLEGLIIAVSSSGNLGNLLLIIIPAVCNENGSPFGDHEVCRTTGLSYASFSMALGSTYIWTYTYHLIRVSSVKFKKLELAGEVSMASNEDMVFSNDRTPLLPETGKIRNDFLTNEEEMINCHKLAGFILNIIKEIMVPSTIATIAGFAIGVTTCLRNFIVGDDAPLGIIHTSIKLLGKGTLPCVTLILGANVAQGFRTAGIRPSVIAGVICIRFILLPVIGIGVVRAADNYGFLSPNPLFHYILMLQFALPPAMNLSGSGGVRQPRRRQAAAMVSGDSSSFRWQRWRQAAAAASGGSGGISGVRRQQRHQVAAAASGGSGATCGSGATGGSGRRLAHPKSLFIFIFYFFDFSFIFLIKSF